jgi:hypothetical protein
MKTLNLNKLTILLGLFLVSAFYTTSANALCYFNGDGAIITVDGDSGAPVKDSVTTYQDDGTTVEYTAGNATSDCLITPDVYKLNVYKFGLCTADPDLNDVTSCQMFFESAAGIEIDVQAGVSQALDIPEFVIDPGTYPYVYVLLSNKFGMKWSGRMSNDVAGSSGGDGGTYCWTANAGLKPSTFVTTNAHGSSLAASVKTMDCGTSEGTVVFANEVLTKFTSESGCSLGANGDRSPFEEKEGAGAARGLPTVNLLTSADVFATTCANAAKIAWTTDLDTPYTITEDSTFEMSIKATEANTLRFSEQTDDNYINTIESGAPKIYLNVTD